jgi:D-ribose pyranose/furanose isomerase RbsD
VCYVTISLYIKNMGFIGFCLYLDQVSGVPDKLKIFVRTGSCIFFRNIIVCCAVSDHE